MWLDVPSPFRPEQLDVWLVNPSTDGMIVLVSWFHYNSSLASTTSDSGNYLVFFSSFHYLRSRHGAGSVRPDVPVWLQESGWRSRSASTIRSVPTGGQGSGLRCAGRRWLLEGRRSPGSRLIWRVLAATLGLPPVDLAQEATRRRDRGAVWRGRGYDYACLVPGVRKVVQAAGRAYRGEGDEGVLYLIDDRFAAVQAKGIAARWATHT